MATTKKNMARKRRTRDEIFAEIRRAARNKRGRCLSTEYRPRTDEWRFECKKGHRFGLTAIDLIDRKNWCPKCAEVKTWQRVVATAKRLGGLCESGSYKPVEDAWKFRCNNGHRVRRSAKKVLESGFDCQKCVEEESIARLQAAAERVGGRCLSKRYSGLAKRYRFECKSGHRLLRQGQRVLATNGFKCRECTAVERLNRIKEAARKKGGECLSRKVDKPRSTLKFRCKEGHAFSGMGELVIDDKLWCPICKESALYSKVLAVVRKKGGECLEEKYRNFGKEWRFRCEKGHDFSRRAETVLYKGAWCPTCVGRNSESMLEKVKAAAKAQGGECVNKKYLARPKKMTFVCAHGHRWKALPSNILWDGSWCPMCAAKLDEETIEQIDSIVAEKNGVRLTNDIESMSDPIHFRCANGHTFEQIPTRLLHDGYWCALCAHEIKAENRRLGIEIARKVAEERGGYCLSNEYGSLLDLADWECASGHQWPATFKSVVSKGTWCPECWNLERRGPREKPTAMHRKLSIEDCHALAERHGGLCLSGFYTNQMHDLTWRCKRKHEWIASLHKMEQREGFCNECRELEARDEWLKIAKTFAKENNGTCLSAEWTGSQSKLRWRCENGHEFERTWNNVKTGPFCGECAWDAIREKRGKEMLSSIAKRHNGKWIESDYLGIREPYRFRCENGCEFVARPEAADRSWNRHCVCKKT